MMKTLTVFTPTYNRAHTLGRVYESLCAQTSRDFEWLIVDDGSTDNTHNLVTGWIAEDIIPIRYIHKENSGLYTAYNTAYANIDTELNVCVDSDDWMPDDAVETIVAEWRRSGSESYAGLLGLDFTEDGNPIGGYFPDDLHETHFLDLYIRKIHRGDSKPVYRSDLTRKFAPMEGFPGEKFFNPVYIALQIDNELPMLVINKNLCFVEYQITDSMSRNIFRQYINSPRSFSKSRMLEMTHRRSTWRNSFRVAAHYVATSLLAHDYKFIKRSPRKTMTLLAVPLGVVMLFYIKHKARK